MDPLQRFIETHVGPEGIAFDIGANVGHYSRILRDRGCRVIAFEPNPKIIARLRDIAGIEIVEAAVSDQIGETAFYIDLRPEAFASSVHQLNGMEGQTERIMVPTVTVDAFCEERKIVPNFIKIDVEGNELSVIKGAQETIRRYHPYIIFEFWECWWNRGVKEIFAMLNPLYEMTVAQTGAPAFEHYTVLGSKLDSSGEMVDILCAPR
jgi:FkbM family methyltransferase